MATFTSPIKTRPTKKGDTEGEIYENKDELKNDIGIVENVLRKRLPGIDPVSQVSSIYGPAILGTMDIWNKVNITIDRDPTQVLDSDGYMESIFGLMFFLAQMLKNLKGSQKNLLSDTRYILLYRGPDNKMYKANPYILEYISKILEPVLKIAETRYDSPDDLIKLYRKQIYIIHVFFRDYQYEHLANEDKKINYSLKILFDPSKIKQISRKKFEAMSFFEINDVLKLEIRTLTDVLSAIKRPDSDPQYIYSKLHDLCFGVILMSIGVTYETLYPTIDAYLNRKTKDSNIIKLINNGIYPLIKEIVDSDYYKNINPEVGPNNYIELYGKKYYYNAINRDFLKAHPDNIPFSDWFAEYFIPVVVAPITTTVIEAPSIVPVEDSSLLTLNVPTQEIKTETSVSIPEEVVNFQFTKRRRPKKQEIKNEDTTEPSLLTLDGSTQDIKTETSVSIPEEVVNFKFTKRRRPKKQEDELAKQIRQSMYKFRDIYNNVTIRNDDLVYDPIYQESIYEALELLNKLHDSIKSDDDLQKYGDLTYDYLVSIHMARQKFLDIPYPIDQIRTGLVSKYIGVTDNNNVTHYVTCDKLYDRLISIIKDYPFIDTSDLEYPPDSLTRYNMVKQYYFQVFYNDVESMTPEEEVEPSPFDLIVDNTDLISGIRGDATLTQPELLEQQNDIYRQLMEQNTPTVPVVQDVPLLQLEVPQPAEPLLLPSDIIKYIKIQTNFLKRLTKDIQSNKETEQSMSIEYRVRVMKMIDLFNELHENMAPYISMSDDDDIKQRLDRELRAITENIYEYMEAIRLAHEEIIKKIPTIDNDTEDYLKDYRLTITNTESQKVQVRYDKVYDYIVVQEIFAPDYVFNIKDDIETKFNHLKNYFYDIFSEDLQELEDAPVDDLLQQTEDPTRITLLQQSGVYDAIVEKQKQVALELQVDRPIPVPLVTIQSDVAINNVVETMLDTPPMPTGKERPIPENIEEDEFITIGSSTDEEEDVIDISSSTEDDGEDTTSYTYSDDDDYDSDVSTIPSQSPSLDSDSDEYIPVEHQSIYRVPNIVKVTKVVPIGPGDIIKMTSSIDTVTNTDYTDAVKNSTRLKKLLDSMIDDPQVKTMIYEGRNGPDYDIDTMSLFTFVGLSKHKINKKTIFGRIVGFVSDNISIFDSTIIRLSEDDVIRISELVSGIMADWMNATIVRLGGGIIDSTKEKKLRSFVDLYCKKSVFPLFLSTTIDIVTDFIEKLAYLAVNGNIEDKEIVIKLRDIIVDISSQQHTGHILSINNKMSVKLESAVAKMVNAVITDTPIPEDAIKTFNMFLYDRFCYPVSDSISEDYYKVLTHDDSIMNQMLILLPTYNEHMSNNINSLYQSYIYNEFMKDSISETIDQPIKLLYDGETISRELIVGVNISPGIEKRGTVDKVYTVLIRWIFKSESGRCDVVSSYKRKKTNKAFHRFTANIDKHFRFGAQTDLDAIYPDTGVLWPIATVYHKKKLVKHIRCHPVYVNSKDQIMKEKRPIIIPNCINPLDSLPTVRELFERLSCLLNTRDSNIIDPSTRINKNIYRIPSDEETFGYYGFVNRVIRMMKYSKFRNNHELANTIMNEQHLIYQLAYCKHILSTIDYKSLNNSIKLDVKRECDRMQYLTYVSEKYDIAYTEKMISDLITYCSLVSDTNVVQFRSDILNVTVSQNDKIFNDIFKRRFKPQYIPLLTELRTDYLFSTQQWRYCNRQVGMHLVANSSAIDRHDTEHSRLERELLVNTLYVNAVIRLYRDSYHPKIIASEIVKTKGHLNEKYTNDGIILSYLPKNIAINYYNIISNVRGDIVKERRQMFDILDRKIQEARLLCIRHDYKGKRSKAIMNGRNLISRDHYKNRVENLRYAVASYNYMLYSNLTDIRMIPDSVDDMVKSLGGDQFLDKCTLNAILVPELDSIFVPTTLPSIITNKEKTYCSIVDGDDTMECMEFYNMTVFQTQMITKFINSIERVQNIAYTLGQSASVQRSVVEQRDYSIIPTLSIRPDVQNLVDKLETLKNKANVIIDIRDIPMSDKAVIKLVDRAIKLAEYTETLRETMNNDHKLHNPLDEELKERRSVITPDPITSVSSVEYSPEDSPPSYEETSTPDSSPPPPFEDEDEEPYETLLTPQITRSRRSVSSQDEFEEEELTPLTSSSNDVVGLRKDIEKLSETIDKLAKSITDRPVTVISTVPSIPSSVMGTSVSQSQPSVFSMSAPPPPPPRASPSKKSSDINQPPSTGGISGVQGSVTEELVKRTVIDPHDELYTGILTELLAHPIDANNINISIYEDDELKQRLLEHRQFFQNTMISEQKLDVPGRRDLQKTSDGDFINLLMTNRYYLTLLKEPTKENLSMLRFIRDTMFAPSETEYNEVGNRLYGRMTIKQFDDKYKKQVQVDIDKPFTLFKQRDYKLKLGILVKQLEDKISQGIEVVYTEDIKNINDIKNKLGTGRPSTEKKLDDIITNNIGMDQFNELLKQEKLKPKEVKKFISLTDIYSPSQWFGLTESAQISYRRELYKYKITIPNESFYNFNTEDDYYDYLSNNGLYNASEYTRLQEVQVDPRNFPKI